MTSDNTPVDASLTQEEEGGFGKQLQAQREKLGLSVQEAASRLRLSPRFILQMETENLSQSTLPPIYLRGYLRAYSRLLHIPADVLNAVLEHLEPTPAILTAAPKLAAEPLSSSFPLEANPYYFRLASICTFLVLLTSMTTWWYLHTKPETVDLASAQTSAQTQNMDPGSQNSGTPFDPQNVVVANAPQAEEQQASPTAALQPLTSKAPAGTQLAALDSTPPPMAASASQQAQSQPLTPSSGSDKEESEDTTEE